MPKNNQRMAVLVTLACAALALALFTVPAWIIQPFRAQDQGQLAMALAMKRIAPIATLLLFVTALAGTVYFRPRRWSAALCGVAVALSALFAVATRVNYFELMFHPNPSPAFVAAANAGVDADDMVMVARIGNEARAYPVRVMAYHHLVNDTVGGVPIVPTY